MELYPPSQFASSRCGAGSPADRVCAGSGHFEVLSLHTRELTFFQAALIPASGTEGASSPHQPNRCGTSSALAGVQARPFCKSKVAREPNKHPAHSAQGEAAAGHAAQEEQSSTAAE